MANYIAYIDESGDPGIRKISAGGSQWFIISCLLIREEHIPTISSTQKCILNQFKKCQTKHIHFKNLLPFKKLIACSEIAKAPCRAFGVISNKINILNYKNPNLRRNKDWLYWWMTRILLERVTDFCCRHAKRHGIANPKLQIIFSRRNSNNYDEFKSYLMRLSSQSKTGSLYINIGDLSWSLYDPEEIHIVDAKNSVGLQLADVIAGAIYNGLETGTRQHTLDYISALLPIIAKSRKNRILGYGVKCFPSTDMIALNEMQKKFFKICNYNG